VLAKYGRLDAIPVDWRTWSVRCVMSARILNDPFAAVDHMLAGVRIVHDRDEDLLELAAAEPPGPAADGATVTVEAKRSDITRLRPGDVGDATLITASALLDMLTEGELRGLVGVCAGAGCPVLLTLSVVGRVRLIPA